MAITKKTRLTRAAAALAFCLAGARVAAAPFMIVGMDQKQTWDETGQRVLAPTGNDRVAIVDLAKPEAPRIVATLKLENSIAGPPVNVAISPDNRFALVADSYTVVKKGGELEIVPTDKLFVIDLTGRRPRLAQTLTVGEQPSGLCINAAGTLALVAYRAGQAVGVFRIDDGRLHEVGRIPMGDNISDVTFTPDGRRALAVKHQADRVSLLSVDGDHVSYDGVDLPTRPAPYVVDVTPDGRLGLASDRDFITVIDLTTQPPRVIDEVPVAHGAEGFAVSPRGEIAASVALRGSNGDRRAPGYHEHGAVVILRIDGKKVTPIKTIEVGGVPEAVGFAPDGRHLYVGNFLDKNLWILRVNGTDVTDTGKRLALPGRPASGRTTPASR